MHYREQAASPDLAHIVLSYWEFTVPPGDANEPRDHEIFPTAACRSFITETEETRIRGWASPVRGSIRFE